MQAVVGWSDIWHPLSMTDTEERVAKKAKRGDTSVDVHSAEASAPAEQQTEEAAAPSQQAYAEELFGMLGVRDAAQVGRLISACAPMHAGAGLQGPAGVRTEGVAVDDELTTSHGDFDLGPGAPDRPEGIVGPSGMFALLAGISSTCDHAT